MGTWTRSSKNSEIPKQYLKGWVEFYKLKFKVDGRVLIPRPETELLVDIVIATARKQSFTILDIGTGSGNIAIALAKNLPKAKIFATDISEEALELARENAKLNKVQDKIFFIQSDLLQSIRRPEDSLLQLDVIVTNLPYIPRGRIPFLDPSVKDFEPWIALDGGPDGFDLYRKLFQQIKQRMHNPGLETNLQTGIGKLKLIVCEIDDTQELMAKDEAQKYFPKAKVEVKTDLAQNIRILIIQPT